MSWTDQKIQMLREMWGNGYSASDIARRIGGMTRNAVIGKAHRLNLSARANPLGREGEKVTKSAIVRVKEVKKVAAPKKVSAPVQASVRITAKQAPALRREPVIDMAVATQMTEAAIAPVQSTERHCRWPFGDPRSKEFKYCGCRNVEGFPYCEAHARIAYQNFGRMRAKREEIYG